MANKNNPYEDIYGIKQGEANEQDEIISDVPEIQAEDELPKGVSFDELEDDNDEEYYVDEIDDSPINNLEEEELSEFDEGFNQVEDYMPDEIRENKLTQKGKEAKNKKQGPVKTVPFTQPESQAIHNESIEHLSDIPQIELNDTEFNYEVRDNEIVSFAEFDTDENSFEEISALSNSSETSFENEEIVETSIEEIKTEADSDTIIPEFEISTEKTQKNDSLFFSSDPQQSNETFVTVDEPENIKTSYFPEEAEMPSSNSVVVENDNPNNFVEKRENDGFVAYTDSYDNLNKEYHSSTLDVTKEAENVSTGISNIPVFEEQKQEYSHSAFTEQLSSHGFTNIEIKETGGDITVSADFYGNIVTGYINKESGQVESDSNDFKFIAEHTYNMFSPAPVSDTNEVTQFGAYTEIKDEKRNFWSSEEFISKITDGNNSFSDISIQKNQNDTTTYSGKYNGQNFTIKLDDISHKPLDSNISGEAMSFFSSSLSDYNSLVAEREHKEKTTEMYADKLNRVDDDYSSVGYSKRVSYNELHKTDEKVDVKPVTNGNGFFEGETSNPFVSDSSFGGIVVGNTAHRYNPNNSQNNVNAIITSKAKASQYGDIQAVEHSQNAFKSPLNAKDLYVQAVATNERHFDASVRLSSFSSSYDAYNALKSHYNSQESLTSYNKYNGNRYQNAFEENLYQNNNYPSLNNSFNSIHKQTELNNNSTNTVDTSGIFKKIDEQYKLMSARSKFDRNKVKQLGQMAMTPLESKIKEVSNSNDVAEGVHVYGDVLAIPKFLLIDKGRQSAFNDCLRDFAAPYFNNSENAQYVNKIFRSVTQDSSLNVFQEEYFNKKTGSYELRDVHLSNLKSVDKIIKRYQNDALKDINIDVTRMSSKGISALIEEKKKLLKKEGLSKADIDALNKDIKTLSGYLYLRNFKLNHSEMVSDASWEMLQKAGLKIPKNYKELRIDTIDGFNKFIKEINTQLQAYGIKDIRKLTKRDLDNILGKKRKVFKDKKGKFEDVPPEIKKLLERFVSKDGQALLNSFNSLNNKTNSLSSFLSLIRREIGDSDVLEGSMIYLKMVKTVRKTVHYSVSIAQRLAHFTHLDRALAKYGKKAVKKLEKVAPKAIPKVRNSSKAALENARNIKNKYGVRGIKERARKKVMNRLTKSKSKIANALAKTLHKAAKVTKALRAVSRVVTKYFLVAMATVAACILAIGLIGQFISLLVAVVSFPSVAWAKITGEDASNKPIVDVYNNLVSQEEEWQNAIQKYSDYSIKQMFNEDTGFNFAVDTNGYYDLRSGRISSIKNFGGAEYTSENANISHKNGIEYHYYDSYYWQMNDDGTVKLKNGKPEINPYANETGFRSNVKEIMAVGDIFVQMDYSRNRNTLYGKLDSAGLGNLAEDAGEFVNVDLNLNASDIYHSYVGYKGDSIKSSLIQTSNTKKDKDLNYKNENTGVDLFSATHYFAPDLGELYSCDGCKNTTIKCNDSYLNGILGNSKAIYSCRDGNFYNGTKVTSWDGAYHSEGCVKHQETKVKGYYNKAELLVSNLKDSFAVVYCDGYHKVGSEYIPCKEAGGHNTLSYYLTDNNLKIAKLSDAEFDKENNKVKSTCDNYTFVRVTDKNNKAVSKNITIKYYVPETTTTEGKDGSFTRNSLDFDIYNYLTEIKKTQNSNLYNKIVIGSWYAIIYGGSYVGAENWVSIIARDVKAFNYRTSYRTIDNGTEATNDDVLIIFTVGDSNRKCESQWSHRNNTSMTTVSAGGYNVSVRYRCNTCYSPSTTETTYKEVSKTINLPKYKAVCEGHCGGHNVDYCTGHKDLIVRATIFSTVEEDLICGQEACSNPLHQLYFEPENMSAVAQHFNSFKFIHNSQCHIHGPECLPQTSVYFADVMSGPSSLEYIPAKYLTSKRTNWGVKSTFLKGVDDYEQSLEEMDINPDFQNIYLTDKYLSKYAWSHGLSAETNKDLVSLKLLNSWSNVGVYATENANASVQTIHTSEQKELINKLNSQISSGDYYNLSGLGSAEKDKDMYGEEAIENVEDGVMLNDDVSDRNKKILAERLNNRLYFVQYALSTVGKVPYYDSGIASNTGFEGNSFGTINNINGKSLPDTLGRTLKGLNDTSWIIWAYKSAFDSELNEKYVVKTMNTFPSANTEHLNFGTFLPTANWTQFPTAKSNVTDINEEYRKLLPGDILVNATTGRKAIFLMWADNNTLSSKFEETFSTDNLLRMYVIEESYYCEDNNAENAPKVNNVQIRICNREEWSAYSSDILNFGTAKSTYSYGTNSLGFPTDVFKVSYMSSPYGWRILNLDTMIPTIHNGVDLVGPIGTPLYAIADGQVVLARHYGSAGQCIQIKSNINGIDYTIVYMHCSAILVKQGDTVKAGQTIGLMGGTGKNNLNSDYGYHLHFEVRLTNGYQRVHPGTLVPVFGKIEERSRNSLIGASGKYITGESVCEPFNEILWKVQSDPSLYNQYFGQSIVSSNKSESTANGISLSFSPLAKKNGEQIKKCNIYRSVYDLAYETWSDFKKISSVDSSSGSISYLDTDVKIGYKYCYYIQGNDGLSKVKSPEVVVSHTLAPEVKISNTSSGINITWNKITGATGYVVYRYTLNGDSWSSATKIKTLNNSTFSFDDTAVDSGSKYKYKVKAYYKDSGNEYVSYSSLGTSNILMYLTQPTVTVKKNTGNIAVSWTKSAGATNYIIYRKSYNSSTKKWSSWTKINTLTVNNTSYKDTSVKSGTQYKDTVKATNGSYSSSYKESEKIAY